MNRQGSVQIINNTKISNPDEIRIDTEIIGSNVNTITIDNIENEIQLIWKNKLTTCNSMFRNLIYITEIDFSLFDSSNVTDMKAMFYNCTSLKSINFDNFNTAKVKDMSYTFAYCHSLTSLNISSFEVSEVVDMEAMFYGCFSLKILNLSNFVTESNKNLYYTFGNCMNLEYLNVAGFKTNLVTNFGGLFFNCYSLKSLNLSHFESGIIIADYMFYNCTSITYLDISNLGKNNPKGSYSNTGFILMRQIFQNCNNLRYLNWKNLKEYSYNYLYLTVFKNTPQNLVICITDSASDLKTIFSNRTCGVIDCSENWEANQKKINGETGDCMDSCNGEFLYEYNTICYRECPEGTKDNKIQYYCEEVVINDEIININKVLETTELPFENEIISENMRKVSISKKQKKTKWKNMKLK